MKKIRILLVLSCLLCFSGCDNENTKHHHKTNYTITLFSVFGDTVNSWGCKINEVKQYRDNQISFIDSLGNETRLYVYSGSVIVEKKHE